MAYEVDHENLLNVFLNHKPVIEPMQTDISSRNQITFFAHLKRGGRDDRSSGNTYELVKFVGYFSMYSVKYFDFLISCRNEDLIYIPISVNCFRE